MGTYNIAVLPGDGIGPEVTEQALHVLQSIAGRFGHTFDTTYALVGVSASYDELNAKVRPERALFRLRRELALFANLRPVRPFNALLNASTIKPEALQETDLLVVRELTGGLYFGKPSEIRETPEGYVAIDTLLYTEAEIERILRTAFELARGRRKKLTSVDKANVLSSSRLWRRVADRVAADFPDVAFDHLLVDACAMHLIRRPATFDVIVTENLFGDILTDEASMLAGSMGMLPSASLGTRRTAYGLFG